MWRATQGCHDPRSSVRVPGRDLACSQAPGVYDAGFCECSDGLPRHMKCGESKETCTQRCRRPMKVVEDLPSFEPRSSASPAEGEEPPRASEAGGPPLYIVALVVLVLTVAGYVWGSTSSDSGRARLVALVARQRRARRMGR